MKSGKFHAILVETSLLNLPLFVEGSRYPQPKDHWRRGADPWPGFSEELMAFA